MAIIIVDDYRYFLNSWATFYVGSEGSCIQLVHISLHIVHVHSLLFCLCLVVESRVGRQAQLHRQEVYESLKEYLKGGYFVIPYSQKYWRELNLSVEPKIAIVRILADLYLAVRYGIAIRIFNNM